jgi:hypothetical protein
MRLSDPTLGMNRSFPVTILFAVIIRDGIFYGSSLHIGVVCAEFVTRSGVGFRPNSHWHTPRKSTTQGSRLRTRYPPC